MSALVEKLKLLLSGQGEPDSEYTIEEQKEHLIEDIEKLEQKHDRYRDIAIDAQNDEYNRLYR